MQALTGAERAERARAGPDRVDQEAQLACAREAERHRARQDVPGRVEHEELAGHAGVDRAGLDAQERVRPDRLGAGDPQLLSSHAPVPMRSWSESAVSARAFAIACTAAAAPEIVVMQGTRATSAASRMR